MVLRSLDKPGPIEAVLFDFHSTLIDQGAPEVWLERAWSHAGRAGTAAAALGAQRSAALAEWLDRIWEHARDVDPRSERDLSPVRHRAVFDAVIARAPAMDAALAHSLYEVMLDTWVPYDDALPVLCELQRRGRKLALISNIGLDLRPLLARAQMAPLFEAVVLSYEVGAVKPAAAIFEAALDALGTRPRNALMVGDSAHDDGGAALLGVRTLLLPRTAGAVHGLEMVLRVVGE